MKIVNALLLALIAWCLFSPLRHQFEDGWFYQADYYWLGAAAVLSVALFLPAVFRSNLLILVLIIVAIECGFQMLALSAPDSPVVVQTLLPSGVPANIDDVRLRNETMGYEPRPGVRYHSRKTLAGELVYEATFSIDSVGRRITPAENSENRSQYMLFFGGSNTFGHGVNDDETFAYYLGEVASDYQPYNYAYGGYGPAHMLARLQTGKLREQVTQADGFALYYFIDDHVKRVMNTLKTHWTHRSPVYFLDQEGVPQRAGNFHTTHPYLYSLYREVLLKSKAVMMLPIDIPPRINRQDLRLTCAIITESYSEYRKQMGNDRFYMVIRPSGGSRELGQELRPCVEAAGIKVLEAIDRPWRDDERIAGDGHPTTAAYRKLAHGIARVLELDLISP